MLSSWPRRHFWMRLIAALSRVYGFMQLDIRPWSLLVWKLSTGSYFMWYYVYDIERPETCRQCNRMNTIGYSMHNDAQCDECIVNIDHHCQFLGTCICKRNLEYFKMTLFSGCVAIYLLLSRRLRDRSCLLYNRCQSGLRTALLAIVPQIKIFYLMYVFIGGAVALATTFWILFFVLPIFVRDSEERV